MKILLQNFVTGLYLGGSGRWTQNPHGALAFLSATRATGYKIYHRLADTYVVVLPGTLDTMPPTRLRAEPNPRPGREVNQPQPQSQSASA